MKISFVLSTVSLMASCLVFACGCQNESTAVKRYNPARMSYEAVPKTGGISVSEHLALDQLVSEQDGSFDSKQVSWEEDISQDGERREPPNLEEVFNLESTELGKLSGDGTEMNDFRKRASRR